MPTDQELVDLSARCDWTWTTMNGVMGYVVRGRGGYSSASIFLPAAGYGLGTSLNNAGLDGGYCSSVPSPFSAFGHSYSRYLGISYWDDRGHHGTDRSCRDYGWSIRPVHPVQGFSE